MATYPVKWYASQMQGAPSLGDTTDGALSALLKAVLVTGFGNLTVNTIAWDSATGWAKATISGGHAYLQDSVITVSGATPTAYNGEHRVKQVNATEVWFEVDGGDPGSAASGTLAMMVAPLGWTLTHESGDGKVAIYRPTDIANSGNVSLRIDNSAWSGWNTYSYLAKVMLVEDVVDINTYTLIYEHRWPATKRYSDGRWDLIGDSQLFHFLPAYANFNAQSLHTFGYINSLRPGDRYHAVLIHYPSLVATDTSRQWSTSSTGSSYTNNVALAFDDATQRALARGWHQIAGAVTWSFKGLFARAGFGLAVPNSADNAFYVTPDPLMVIETGSVLRGYMPGLVNPLGTLTAWQRKNLSNMPAIPNKIVRFILATYAENPGLTSPNLIGFDLTGPWR